MTWHRGAAVLHGEAACTCLAVDCCLNVCVPHSVNRPFIFSTAE